MPKNVSSPLTDCPYVAFANRSGSWYRKKYSSYFFAFANRRAFNSDFDNLVEVLLKDWCETPAEHVSASPVHVSPVVEAETPSSVSPASDSSISSKSPSPISNHSGSTLERHLPSVNSPAAAGPPGASSFNAFSAARR